MIYIVEDDAAIRELEQYALQSSGYEVTSFESSEPFWQAMHAAEPELVILDVMLPGEDGFSILKKLRNTPSLRRLPVIMVTAKSSELDTVRGLDCGADDYISKPFGIMEFLSRVRAALGGSCGDRRRIRHRSRQKYDRQNLHRSAHRRTIRSSMPLSSTTISFLSALSSDDLSSSASSFLDLFTSFFLSPSFAFFCSFSNSLSSSKSSLLKR